jgi:NAD(P)-dependent dehydrogenase (short-subunit alcohol dehydrogenase family)
VSPEAAGSLNATHIRLDGEVAVVTGGGRGIGRAIARSLGEAGASVAVVARTPSDVEATAAMLGEGGGEAVGIRADVTDEASVDTTMREAERSFGPVTILVNCAGTCSAIGPLWEIEPDDWRRDVDASLLGTFLCARAVLPSMVARRRGRVINVSSYAAIRATPHIAAYGAAKAALVHLTNTLAAETAPFGVSVFAMTPGRVRTAMTEYMLESQTGKPWSVMPTGEWLPAERAGALAVVLSSGRADALSGRFIHVLDDVEELVRRADEIRRDDLYALRLRA